MDTTTLVERFLEITEDQLIPLTERGVAEGHKIFGAAILKKSDLSIVIKATNHEIENPLWHGEVYAIKLFYELAENLRPSPKDCLFFATHEPCSLCLSAITWSGFDNFYYLFDYHDSRDAFNIPHDLNILQEVFHCAKGQYAPSNPYWESHHLIDLIESMDEKYRLRFIKRVDRLRALYSKLSEVYQKSKARNHIPFP